jgi:hypothetical protein
MASAPALFVHHLIGGTIEHLSEMGKQNPLYNSAFSDPGLNVPSDANVHHLACKSTIDCLDDVSAYTTRTAVSRAYSRRVVQPAAGITAFRFYSGRGSR